MKLFTELEDMSAWDAFLWCTFVLTSHALLGVGIACNIYCLLIGLFLCGIVWLNWTIDYSLSMKILVEHPDFNVPDSRIWTAVWDEVLEFIEEPCWDEFSDICFGIGRCLGFVFSMPYVRFPFDNDSLKKKLDRMDSYGHYRSKRHLVQDGHGIWVYPNPECKR